MLCYPYAISADNLRAVKSSIRSISVRLAVVLCMAMLCSVVGQIARAQTQPWTPSDANNNISNTNTGNVGIGTVNPEQVLHANGASEILSTGSGAGFKFRDRGQVGTDNWVWYSTGNIARFWRQGVGDLMGVTTAGNFGVGMTNPLVRLDVQGAANIWAGGRYAVAKGYMAPGSLTIGDYTKSFGGGNSWTTNTAGLLLETQANTEIAVHDSDDRLASFMFYEGDAVNRITIGRNMGWGTISTLALNGNVGIGISAPQAKLDVNGNANITGSINVAGNINAKYQDVAEWVPSLHALAAGTVVALDPNKSNHVLASSHSYDTRVAGVISAQPGIALGESGANKVLVATTGRVKVKVDATHAPIKVGDLLVTSDKEGLAMKSEPMLINGRQFHSPGTLIGKALEPLANGTGEILVLLSLQ